MKNNSYLHLLLSFFLIVPLGQSAWIVYDQFTGYIPSYIYPVTVNAGDVITATLSWSGSEDLDIYFYKDGMDLLSDYSYIVR